MLATAVHDMVSMVTTAAAEQPSHNGDGNGNGMQGLAAGARSLFDACIPAIPYAAAGAFLGREKLKLTRSDGDRPRVALVADGLGGMHGVTHTIQQIRDRGVPGFEVEVALSLIDAPLLRERLRRAALSAVRDRGWETALDRLAAGYLLALSEHVPAGARNRT